jgi:hypothetical protein
VMVIGNTHAPQVNGLNNGTISFFSSWCLWQMHIQKVLFVLRTFHPNINKYIHIWKNLKPPHHFMFQFFYLYVFLSLCFFLSFSIFFFFLYIYIYIYIYSLSLSLSLSIYIYIYMSLCFSLFSSFSICFYVFVYFCFLFFEAVAQLRWI